MLDTPIGTIKSRLMKARIYLRKATQIGAGSQGGFHYERV